MLARDEQLPALRTPHAFQASFERDWKVGSFTSLVRDLPSAVSDLRPQPHNPAGDEFLHENLHLPLSLIDFIAIEKINFDGAVEEKYRCAANWIWGSMRYQMTQPQPRQYPHPRWHPHRGGKCIRTGRCCRRDRPRGYTRVLARLSARPAGRQFFA
jgi:hypothetical protein